MDKKGFTLVELLVSFTLVTIVMVFFSKTIVVGIQKENKLLSMQEYTVFEATFLKAVNNEIKSLKNITVSESGNSLIITGTSNESSISKTLNFTTSGEKSISFNNIIYPLPNNTDFVTKNGKNFLVNRVSSNKIIINIFLKHENTNKNINIIINN